MTQYNRVDSSNLDALVATTGVVVLAAGGRTGGAAALPAAWGVTLSSSTTYYFPVGSQMSGAGSETTLESIHIHGDAAIVITAATLECSNFGSTTSPGDGRGAVDVSDFDTSAGNWITENPSTATVSTVGAGWTATAASLAVIGGALGGAIWQVGNLGVRRARLKVVVGATGGLLRVAVWGKAGA